MTASRFTAETRARISAAMVGNTNSLGHRQTVEHRRKVSAARKGKSVRGKGWKHSPETRAKISAALAGVYASPKKRENLRIAQRVIKLFKPEIHAKRAALSAERMRAQMRDQGYRERVSAGLAAYWARRRAEKGRVLTPIEKFHRTLERKKRRAAIEPPPHDVVAEGAGYGP